MAAFVQGNSLQCLEPREGDPEPAAGDAAAAPPPAADATETAPPPAVGATDDPSDDADERARRAGLLLETPEERAADARRSRSPRRAAGVDDGVPEDDGDDASDAGESAASVEYNEHAVNRLDRLLAGQANVAHCSGGFAEAVQLRRRYAVMKEAARARRR